MREENVCGKPCKKFIFGCVVAAICVVVLCFISVSDGLDVTNYDIVSENLPPAFDGFKIVQISDLHNATYLENNDKIIQIISEEKPDMVALTGDIVDRSLKNMSDPGIFIHNVAAIVPVCYYVTGNHEYKMGPKRYGAFQKILNQDHVKILKNQSTVLSRGKDSITVIGVDDPFFITDQISKQKTAIDRELRQINVPKSDYKLLLSHRPEAFDIYVANGIDLVLTGHTHGGQIRVPVIGCLYAPHQGRFPKYVEGTFTQGRTTMVISRGLGCSTLPFRINNNPELVIITLRRSKH